MIANTALCLEIHNIEYKTVAMSLFKTKLWWSNEALLDEKIEGIQNGKSIKVDKFASHSDSDCILAVKDDVITIYRPSSENTPVILEAKLDNVILEITTGKFTTTAEDRQILILHPQSYAIYALRRNEGHIDIGDQNSLDLIIKHSFNRKSFSVICGPFGNSRSRDFICVQALDGTLSFFDQDTFMFMCVYNDVVIPGPVCYVPSNDIFVICKSTWILETYSYQQLGEFSELSVKTNKKNIPQWTYNAGEEILSIEVIRTSTNFSSIIVLGERHIYCFQDNGLMKFTIRFDYMPVCFHAYLFGWYYEPNSRLLIMVASEDSKLYIYEGSSLLWSCTLLHRPICLSRCFLKSLSGGLVTLTTNGVLVVSYLGTEPDLNSNANPIHEPSDPRQIQAELEEVEESLEKIMDVEEDLSKHFLKIDRILKIKADVGKPQTANSDDGQHKDTCSLVVIITCEEPSLIQSIQLTYSCHEPIDCSECTVCLDNINGTEIIETKVTVSGDLDIYDPSVHVLFTIIDSGGQIMTLTKQILLPLNFYTTLTNVVLENKVELTINTNYPNLSFEEIFSDFTSEELSTYTTNNALTILMKNSNKTVTIKLFNDRYIIEADDFCEICPILYSFVSNLECHFVRIGRPDVQIKFVFHTDLGKQIIHKFLKNIESHAKERMKLKTKESELNVLQRQFTLVQKKLLVQYGSLPPGDCEPLEYLMKDSYERIINVARSIMENKLLVYRAANNLSAVGRVLMLILRNASKDQFNVKLIEETLCLDSLDEHFQEWEEAVLQASSYIIRNVLKKSDKDREKLATLTDQDILSSANLKRFLKQVRLILERIFNDIEKPTEDTKIITRIEELVEVI